MQLQPKRPPGHASRKALRYAHEIQRLRAEGHTVAAIREALLDAGVSVSLSTVRREVARRTRPPEQEVCTDRELSEALLDLLSTSAVEEATPAPTITFGQRREPDALDANLRGTQPIEAVRDRGSIGVGTWIRSALRRLRAARWRT